MLDVPAFHESKAVNLMRYEVRRGEYLLIVRGFAMRAWSGVFRVAGYVRVEGLLIAGKL